jgi:hypothetical protein
MNVLLRCSLPTSLLLTLLLSIDTSYGARIIHHDLEARVDPQQRSITVTDVLTVALGGQHTGQTLGFFLHRNLVLAEVSTMARELPWSIQAIPSQQALRDYFPAIDPAQMPTYAMVTYYELMPKGPDGLKEEILRLRLVYRGVLADPLTRSGSPHAGEVVQPAGFIEPQGIYLAGESFWVPQRPGELVTFTLRTVFPEGYASVSQGQRIMHEVADGLVRTAWDCPVPQQQIYLIAGQYTVTEERHGNVAIMTFLFTPDPQINHVYIPATKRYLDLYSRLIGPYPYQKFALVENSWQTGLGMPSFTLLGDQVIRLPFVVSTSYGHEILHNWWGNSVYVDGAAGNWSEGLTTYGADHLYAEQRSAEAARDYRRGLLQDYLNYVHGDQALPLKAFRAQTSPAARAVGYGKAAMVFHMLRHMVGEEEYWAALRQFFQDFRFRVASWEAIFSVFAAVTHRDFRTFNAQWIERAGAPFITLDAVRLTQARPPFRLEVDLVQSPPYDLAVPVSIETEQGTVRRTVSLSEPVTRRSFTLDDRPLAVHVDPDFDVFRRLHRAEVPPTLGQALGAASVLIVVPSQGDPALARAYNLLASQWARDQRYTVVRGNQVSSALSQDTTVWVFGLAESGSFSTWALPPGVSMTADRWWIGGTAYNPTQHSLVMTAAHPDHPDQTVNWLIASEPQWVPVIGRKLRHYGKYSFLVFAADTVHGKGVWPLTSSPMRRAVLWE